jgi:hypothetical protein
MYCLVLRSQSRSSRPKPVRLALAFASFALCLFVIPLLADVTARISGAVADPSGALVAGATVTATNIETGATQTTVSDAQGFYAFASLPVGHYVNPRSGLPFFNTSSLRPRPIRTLRP